MAQNEFDIRVCLRICTAGPIDCITECMLIDPTDTIEMGTSKSKFVPKAEKNIWLYSKRYRNIKSLDGCFRDFFFGIPNICKSLQEAKKIGDCVIRLSVVSLMGQIGFALSPQDLDSLSRLGIPFEFSIFSYGGCVDE